MDTARTCCSKDDESCLACCPKFDPPMYLQRYTAVVKILENSPHKVKKVVDFGCAEMNFIKYLKGISGIQEISVIDVDGTVLEMNKYRAAPLAADFLHRRTEPLTISIYQGSVAEQDTRLRQYDAVTCIEIVEHLTDDILAKFPETIFGFIRPKVVVVTTPNADFNVLFPTLKGFRHWDHKFEWTRKEFVAWCNSIIRNYPFYSFSIEGVGIGPADHGDVGYCSQVAHFHLLLDGYHEDTQVTPALSTPYNLIEKFIHPHRAVRVVTPEIILNEAQYYIRMLANSKEWSPDPLHLSIHNLLQFTKLKEACGTAETLINILSAAGFKVVMNNGDPYIEYSFEDENSDYSE